MNTHIPTHFIHTHSLLLGAQEATPPHYHHSPVPQNEGWTTTLGQCSMVPIATSPSYEQEKRGRDGQQQQQHYHPPPCDDGIAPPSSGKKSRQNNYQPPRQVKKSVVAVTGSLVGGGWNECTTSVQMRRELSSGKLDQFFHNDAMDDSLEPAESRRRSMSF